MSVTKLDLTSSRGDETLLSVRFALHVVSDEAQSTSIRNSGLAFAEGEAVLTTNLVRAEDAASTAGAASSILLLSLPQNYYLGYAADTSAYIDRQLKRVGGSPLRYAASREQVTAYASPDTEGARVRVESELASGHPPAQRPELLLEPHYIVGGFEPSVELSAIMRQLEGTVVNLQTLNTQQLERTIMDLFALSEAAQEVLAAPSLHAIVIATIESLLMSQMRMMRWQGLALLGYRFFEGQEQVTIQPAKDAAEQRQRIDDVSRRLASSQMFMPELAWLKTYATHALDLMRIELEGALLESTSDPAS